MGAGENADLSGFCVLIFKRESMGVSSKLGV
jgi:hypothetical protein